VAVGNVGLEDAFPATRQQLGLRGAPPPHRLDSTPPAPAALPDPPQPRLQPLGPVVHTATPHSARRPSCPPCGSPSTGYSTQGKAFLSSGAGGGTALPPAFGALRPALGVLAPVPGPAGGGSGESLTGAPLTGRLDFATGCSSAWLARCVRDAEARGSNPRTPTKPDARGHDAGRRHVRVWGRPGRRAPGVIGPGRPGLPAPGTAGNRRGGRSPWSWWGIGPGALCR